jgi:hypothetical protein
MLDVRGSAVITSGVQVGNLPVGGDKGVGTINTAGDIFKNNTAFTNPAWVFQKNYSGLADAAGAHAPGFGYGGLMSLTEHEQFTRSHFELPLMTQFPDGGIFARGNLVLASVEEAYLYIYGLNHKIEDLEKRLSALEKGKQ